MKEELITFETALLAKEKGFKVSGYHLLNIENATDESYLYELPSQSLLQRWLREVHGIHISINYFIDGEYLFTVTRTINNPLLGRVNMNTPDGMFPTYETTLEAALQTALKLIV